MNFNLSSFKVYFGNTIAFLVNIPHIDLNIDQIFKNIHNVLAIILILVTIGYTLAKWKNERKK